MRDFVRILEHEAPISDRLVLAFEQRATLGTDMFAAATTLPFHRRVLDNQVFCAGEATTDFIETQMGDVL